MSHSLDAARLFAPVATSPASTAELAAIASAAWAGAWPGAAAIIEAFAPTSAQFDVLVRHNEPVKLMFDLVRDGGDTAPLVAALDASGYDVRTLPRGLYAPYRAARKMIYVAAEGAAALDAHVCIPPDAIALDELLRAFEAAIGDPALGDVVRRGSVVYIGARTTVGEPAIGRIRFHHADEDDIVESLRGIGLAEAPYANGPRCTWFEEDYEPPHDGIVHRRGGIMTVGGRTRSIYVPARTDLN